MKAALLVIALSLIAASAFWFIMGAADATDGTPKVAHLATVSDSPSMALVRAVPQADGPFYDMPRDIDQRVVCDRSNREYVLLRTEQGCIAITPLLDEEGKHAVMPRP